MFSLARAHGVGSCQGNGRSGVATICFLSDPFLEMKRETLKMAAYHMHEKKVNTYTFFYHVQICTGLIGETQQI